MTSRDAIRRLLRDVRRSNHKRDRLHYAGTVVYKCDCGAALRVQVCTGIVPPEIDHFTTGTPYVPAPREIACEFCDRKMAYQPSGYYFDETIEGDVNPGKPYLRIPSRRAIPRMLDECVFEAQLVMPS